VVWKWALAGLLCVPLLAGVIANYSQQQRSVMPAIQAMPTPQPTPAQAPASQPTPEPIPPGSPWYRTVHAAPRAELVKLPPPRAVVVRRFPIGKILYVTMPYGGLSAVARYKGELPSTSSLPVNGNHIGDAYFVGDVPWIWLAAPGATVAAWVDP
jgi:hypothetical protein